MTSDPVDSRKGGPYVGNSGRWRKGVVGSLHRCYHDPCVLAIEDVFGFCIRLLVRKRQG